MAGLGLYVFDVPRSPSDSELRSIADLQIRKDLKCSYVRSNTLAEVRMSHLECSESHIPWRLVSFGVFSFQAHREGLGRYGQLSPLVKLSSSGSS